MRDADFGFKGGDIVHSTVQRAIDSVNKLVLGKERVVRLAMACLLAQGHLLLEDIPGIGKTTLALTLARTLGLEFGRIQFTSDLLPADITGTSVLDARDNTFHFRSGPIFHQLILADEINRATPKTQSALLEAMGEGQVSAEGVTYPLPQPFFVVATQNPTEQYGTFPLPESQLDRFFMSLRMDYPARDAERELLNRPDTRQRIRHMEPVMTGAQLMEAQAQAGRIRAAESLLDYVLDLAWATRHSDRLAIGVSPRGAKALVEGAKAWAYLEHRDFCIPEDVQTVAVPIMRHRLVPRGEYLSWRREHIAEAFLREVAIL
ncbi:MAG: AAA domain-containing protein [Actinobacteria bacterium]|nr:AAA domain-containing protein [Actinomycetota bacterium]